MIFTTAYTSTMVRPMTDPELVDLLLDSRARNADRGVTGLLLYRGGRVLQMLEGDEPVVRNLYDRIRMDVRHQQVTNVWSSTASERRFPDWSMGFEDLEGRQRVLPNGEAVPVVADESGWALLTLGESTLSAEQREYLQRRSVALKRALASGDRLVSALAVILNGHDPETVVVDARERVRCRECRGSDDAALDAYPCPTAKNALWALEAAGPR